MSTRHTFSLYHIFFWIVTWNYQKVGGNFCHTPFLYVLGLLPSIIIKSKQVTYVYPNKVPQIIIFIIIFLNLNWSQNCEISSRKFIIMLSVCLWLSITCGASISTLRRCLPHLITSTKMIESVSQKWSSNSMFFKYWIMMHYWDVKSI